MIFWKVQLIHILGWGFGGGQLQDDALLPELTFSPTACSHARTRLAVPAACTLPQTTRDPRSFDLHLVSDNIRARVQPSIRRQKKEFFIRHRLAAAAQWRGQRERKKGPADPTLAKRSSKSQPSVYLESLQPSFILMFLTIK